jgi:cyanuric acid amidohydrolase
MRDAGITDPADVHYVQTKTPLLTVAGVADAASRGRTVVCDVQKSSGISNGTSALGVAVGLGEIAMPSPDQICRDLDLYSTVASCSSGVEFAQAQIILLGNRPGAGGDLRIGHALMADMLDMDAVFAAIRVAGLELPDRPRATDLGGRLVSMFIKCEPNRNALLRGRRQVMFNDSDVPYHRHAKAAVGGAVTAAIGDPCVFISVDAMHSGPHGSGPVAAIVDLGERQC